MANPIQTLSKDAPSGGHVTKTVPKALPVPKDLINDPAIRERVQAPSGKLRFLGHGMYAGVYDLGDGRVLKLTKDKKDAQAFANVLHRPAPAFAVTLDVFQIKGHGVPVYGIVSEKLKPVSSTEELEWNIFAEIYFYGLLRPLTYEQKGINTAWATWVRKVLDIWGNHVVQVGWQNQDPNYWPFNLNIWNSRFNPPIIQAFDQANIVTDDSKQQFLVKVAKSLEHARITWWDLHGGNIMRRPGAKRLVVADLGLSRSPKVKIPVLGKSHGPRVFDVAAAAERQEALYKDATERLAKLRTASPEERTYTAIYEGIGQRRDVETETQALLESGDVVGDKILEASRALQDEEGRKLFEGFVQEVDRRAAAEQDATSPDVLFRNEHIEVVADTDEAPFQDEETEVFASDGIIVVD